jgi:hypothetical protein
VPTSTPAVPVQAELATQAHTSLLTGSARRVAAPIVAEKPAVAPPPAHSGTSGPHSGYGRVTAAPSEQFSSHEYNPAIAVTACDSVNPSAFVTVLLSRVFLSLSLSLQKNEDSVKGILAQCCDVNWDVRRKGCVALKDVASDVSRQHEIRSSVDSIAKAVADRMDDRNHKVDFPSLFLLADGSFVEGFSMVQVVQAAMDAAMSLLDHHGTQFKPCMEYTLVPKFMMHVQSLTAGTAAKVSELVSKMIEVYSDCDVVTWATKALINTAEVKSVDVSLCCAIIR